VTEWARRMEDCVEIWLRRRERAAAWLEGLIDLVLDLVDGLVDLFACFLERTLRLAPGEPEAGRNPECRDPGGHAAWKFHHPTCLSYREKLQAGTCRNRATKAQPERGRQCVIE